LGYLFVHGVKIAELRIFYQAPQAIWGNWRRMANAIVGSGKVLLVATMIGVPIGFLAGVFLAELQRQDFCLHYSLRGRSAQRRAVHRDRNCCVCVGGAADASLFGASGGRGACIMMIPIAVRTTKNSCVPCRIPCAKAPWRSVRPKAKTIFSVVVPAADIGPDFWDDAETWRVWPRDGATAIHRARQHVWSKGWLERSQLSR